MSKKINKEKGWAVYNVLSNTIHTEIFPTDLLADEYKRRCVIKGQMPYESYENAWKRYIIVPITVTYNIPK